MAENKIPDVEKTDKLNASLDRVGQELQEINGLLEKQRDLTEAEAARMQQFKKIVAEAAAEYRSMQGDQVSGMRNFSVVMKAAEDKRVKFEAENKKLTEQRSTLDSKASKIQNALAEDDQKKRKKAIKEVMADELVKGKNIEKQAKTRLEQLDKERAVLKDHLKINQENLSNSRKQETSLKERAKQYAKISDSDEDVGQGGNEGRRRGRGISLLDIASDLRIPGISQAAQVMRYGRLGMEEGANNGILGQMGGLLKGGVIGGATVFGGMAAMQGYKSYNYAHENAAERRRGLGLFGGRQGEAEANRLASDDYLLQMGYGAKENQAALQGLATQIGGRAAKESLKSVSTVGFQYGLERQQVGGMAEQAMLAGAAPPEQATSQLERIMAEGVASGIDRARITHFTQQALGIQEQLFKVTGENQADDIAKALGTMLEASGQGEAFLRGPAMQALQGFDAAMKSAGKGGEGAGSATLFRAFGFGSEDRSGKGTGERYYQALKEMEGGLFGKGTGAKADPIGRIRKIVGQYDTESGGNQQISNVRMMRELGVGLSQLDRLREVVKGATSPAGKKQAESEIQKVMDSLKDPNVKLLEIGARQEELLKKMANENFQTILAIDQKIYEVQSAANSSLQNLINVMGGKPVKQLGMGDALLAGGAGMVLVSAITKLSGLFGGLTTAMAGLGGGLTALAAPMAGVMAAAGLGAGIGMGINKLSEKLTTKERGAFGEKSDILEKGVAGIATFTGNLFRSEEESKQATDTYNMLYNKEQYQKDHPEIFEKDPKKKQQAIAKKSQEMKERQAREAQQQGVAPGTPTAKEYLPPADVAPPKPMTKEEKEAAAAVEKQPIAQDIQGLTRQQIETLKALLGVLRDNTSAIMGNTSALGRGGYAGAGKPAAAGVVR